ncbi:Peptidoglycan/xylan/chitin deacetylase, PgdA/CDA1 family [Micromonospora sediminicola]|uniref:Peptidoglycan/xylan/chitin deacetylase, PgdA/CDA1 family n=1 Tax=Micromonospora sediminicola TaxID=946078 RepID=A0A1A9B2Z2_9ACTN|nr:MULTISPECIES: polysaccharide deacetylase family protein [Micromonospora]PGH44031.1 polysaccharide deacetylase family protein [Micromonospora sp. WMMA1996]SBT63287.1 Peptidoglycan/xylan/chitin deacetylase, PgdA/CDA1 family [Micromonospora sediminicola]
MRPRTLLAFALGLVLLVTGCGDPGNTPEKVTAQPSASATAEPSPTPSPKPRPTRTTPPPKPKLRPVPKKLPPGLHRASGSPGVALTFDDGPDPRYTPQILAQLRAARVTATFCVVGRQARRYPQLVAQIVREGHQLCNHSWHHDVDLGRRPVAEIRADLERTNRAIHAAAPGAPITWFRQPGGRWTAEELTVVRQLGLRPLHWSVDPQDWDHPPAKTIIKRVESATHHGSVVLMHDAGGDRTQTMAACRHLIPDLKRRYGIVRLR